MQKPVLCIVGLGYVGLPLAHAFAKAGYTVLGFDISTKRIEELRQGIDRTRELSESELSEISMELSTDPSIIKRADIIIIAVPTPVDEQNNPDLGPVISATELTSKNLKPGAIVCYEATVYPGVTEELCGPLLEKLSGLNCGKEFTLAYSPERINPGDKEHRVTTIVKIVSGQDQRTLDAVADLYGSIVTAGVHRASSIKVAEMAKAIENAQRDLNIAYVNEIALLCHRLGIATKDVLTAAGTKWNFLKFQPGLVGGHCIGVDPYYLVEKARQLGMETAVISAGRALNDSMAEVVADEVIAALPVPAKEAKALILGITFKEDVPDDRNSKVVDVRDALAKAGVTVCAHDPSFTPEELTARGYQPGALTSGPFHAVLFLVAHKEYRELGTAAMTAALVPKGVLYDLKGILDSSAVLRSGCVYRAL